MKDVKVAVVCMRSRPGKIEENLKKTAYFLQEAARAEADLVCFPELSLTGYVLDDPGKILAPSRSGDLVKEVARLAREYEVGVLAGTIEWGEEGPFISHVLADSEGIVGIHRKTHLSPPEKAAYVPGERIRVFPFSKATLGVELCYEAHFPEISTLLALKGAEILFIPHASPGGSPVEKAESWLRHLTARAFDNGAFVVACNQVGKGEEGLVFPGVALALNPAGRVIRRFEGEGETLMTVELRERDLQEVRGHRMKYFLPHRRAELYEALWRGKKG
ncbi:MAG: nitrilase [Deltaproteobacteria bacterium]|nr:nitrilase [Deltaproteobacteria bacterium]MBW2015473.1 nitrilase [Deltaproteobacteria bacterium]MBW2128422.1 nitrilase [Deltaproteobacteria bacterium]MBW2303893.1 nitrilase [Deltaproteobacteria bacterium]